MLVLVFILSHWVQILSNLAQVVASCYTYIFQLLVKNLIVSFYFVEQCLPSKGHFLLIHHQSLTFVVLPFQLHDILLPFPILCICWKLDSNWEVIIVSLLHPHWCWLGCPILNKHKKSWQDHEDKIHVMQDVTKEVWRTSIGKIIPNT
jgi:hypothetical protein